MNNYINIIKFMGCTNGQSVNDDRYKNNYEDFEDDEDENEERFKDFKEIGSI